MIQSGSFWQCVDEDYMEHGKYCCVVGASDHPDFNGDGDIEIKTTSGRLYMKVRRFVLRYVFVKGPLQK